MLYFDGRKFDLTKAVAITARLLFVFSVAVLPYTAGATEPDWGESVSSAIQLAVDTHPSIAAARASARAAGSELRAAKWQRLPSVSVEGLLLDQQARRAQAQIVVDQPLWTGGRLPGAISKVAAQEGAAQSAYDEAILNIAVSTVQAFYEVHRWRERGVILARSLVEHDRLVATMERRYAQEVSPLSDLELVRSRASQVNQQISQARAQEASSYSRLRELVGDPFWTIGALPQSLGSWPIFDDGALTTEAVTSSPLIKRLGFDVQAANAQARISRASIFPQLSGQYTYNEMSGHRVGLVLKAQTDGGLSRFAVADAARERAEASELQVATGQRQVRDQVFALLREYESANMRLDGSNAVAGANQRIMASYMRQFSSGRRTWLDVMNAVRETSAAEIEALEAVIASQSALARIMLLSGRWSPVVTGGTR